MIKQKEEQAKKIIKGALGTAALAANVVPTEVFAETNGEG